MSHEPYCGCDTCWTSGTVQGRTEIIGLRWPPTVNTYWRNVRGKTLISREGRAYRESIAMLAGSEPRTGRIVLRITAHPPDRKRRDLDNILKALLDALQHAGHYVDDSQVDEIHIVRGEVGKGTVDVTIEEFEP